MKICELLAKVLVLRLYAAPEILELLDGVCEPFLGL